MRPFTIKRTIPQPGVSLLFTIILGVIAVANGATCHAQTTAELEGYFRNLVELAPEQIADIRNGRPVGKVLRSRTPNEIFVFGAVYVNANPDDYIRFASDFDRLRQLPEYVSLGKFSDPPRPEDLASLSLDDDEITALKTCKPQSCEVQIPTEVMLDLQKSLEWSSPDIKEQVNRYVRSKFLDHLLAYQQNGNKALGVYQDKSDTADVSQRFESLLSYVTVLPQHLPDFNRYLIDYPHVKPSGVYDFFYWAKVKFGLKPTFRLVQVVVRPDAVSGVPYTVAEKQLYSSHYFRTALDLTFCVRPTDANEPGFYLIKILGSDQAGLTGFKGSIVRKVASGRSTSSLQKSLGAMKQAMERNQKRIDNSNSAGGVQ